MPLKDVDLSGRKVEGGEPFGDFLKLCVYGIGAPSALNASTSTAVDNTDLVSPQVPHSSPHVCHSLPSQDLL